MEDQGVISLLTKRVSELEVENALLHAALSEFHRDMTLRMQTLRVRREIALAKVKRDYERSKEVTSTDACRPEHCADGYDEIDG